MIWTVAIGIALCLLLILRSCLKIYVDCHVNNTCLQYEWNIRLYRIPIFRRMYVHDFDQELDQVEQFIQQGDFNSLIQYISNMRKKGLPILKHARVKMLDWRTEIGTGDATSTATVVGSLWTLKGIFVSILNTHVSKYNKPDLHITPHFNTYKFETHFTCMLSIQLGQAIFKIFRR